MSSLVRQTFPIASSNAGLDEFTAHIAPETVSRLKAACVEESSAPRPVLAVGPGEMFGMVCELTCASTATGYLAVDRRVLGSERFVAVKNFLPELTSEPRFDRTFTAEMRLAASVDHPFVCKVRDFGRVGTGYYVAMEYLQGESLDAVLFSPGFRQEAARQPRLLARLLANLAQGLHALHSAAAADEAGDVSHGDVTTRNLFVLFDGGARVADFGTRWAREKLRSKGENVDYSYLAPEQLENADLDAKVDVWGLGVVLWELLSGRKLFRCATVREAAVQITARRISPPSEFNRQVSEELNRIVLKALNRNRNKRYSSTLEFANELERYLETTGDAIAETEVASWLGSLFPTGGERNRALIEMANVSAERLPHFEGLEHERLQVGDAYLPAAQDEPEQTTHIFAGHLRNTVRSAQPIVSPNPVETVSLRDAPVTVRRPRRGAQKSLWRSAALSFAATVGLGLLGFGAVRVLIPALHGNAARAATIAPAATVALPTDIAPHAPVQPAALVTTARDSSIVVAALKLPESKPLAARDPSASAQPLVARQAAKTAIAKPNVAVPPPTTVKESANGSVLQTGQVFVTTPGGGEVFEKGRLLGRAPGSFELSPGWHTLVIKAGSEDRTATVQVRANSAVMVSAPAIGPRP